ncbi:MAG: sulfite exporter TauE/SafE family protein [Clostridia bacterium]|nr:sulfite exporter TauE/SafE family protein [Clostridia bacterium]
MYVIYFFIALLATTLGALAGLGGGVIIKPALDFLNHYDIKTISVLSSFTVLSMAIVSTIKQLRAGVEFQGMTSVRLVVGAIIGGVFGKIIFTWFVNVLGNDLTAKNIQSIMLASLLMLILYMTNHKEKFHELYVSNKWWMISIGFILGLVSAFLGIGGGPLNVGVLSIFFAMDPKIAAAHSVLIILFSQLSKLISIGISTGFSMYDLSALYGMVFGGILGGFVGAFFSKKLENESVKRIFNIMLCFLIILNIYNCFRTIV